jgi:hypothetical protein
VVGEDILAIAAGDSVRARGDVLSDGVHLTAQRELAVDLQSGHAPAARIETLVLFAVVAREASQRRVLAPLALAGSGALAPA